MKQFYHILPRDNLLCLCEFGESGFIHTQKRQYSTELKLADVQDYLNGAGSHAKICKKYGILSRTQLQKWIKVYIINGYIVSKAAANSKMKLCCMILASFTRNTMEPTATVESLMSTMLPMKSSTIGSVSTAWCILWVCLPSSAESVLPTSDPRRR